MTAGDTGVVLATTRRADVYARCRAPGYDEGAAWKADCLKGGIGYHCRVAITIRQWLSLLVTITIRQWLSLLVTSHVRRLWQWLSLPSHVRRLCCSVRPEVSLAIDTQAAAHSALTPQEGPDSRGAETLAAHWRTGSATQRLRVTTEHRRARARATPGTQSGSA